MSSTILLASREQLCLRYCSNKQQLNPSVSMRARQDDDNDEATDCPSIDTCGWDPGKDEAER